MVTCTCTDHKRRIPHYQRLKFSDLGTETFVKDQPRICTLKEAAQISDDQNLDFLMLTAEGDWLCSSDTVRKTNKRSINER